jgi:DNA-binding phage protein
MTRRSRDWNEQLAKDLRNVKFAREFVLALLDEGFTLQQAFAKTIRAYGIKEFAKRAKMPSSNVSRAIRPSYNPSQRLLERLLKPLGLKLTVAPAKVSRKGGKAA